MVSSIRWTVSRSDDKHTHHKVTYKQSKHVYMFHSMHETRSVGVYSWCMYGGKLTLLLDTPAPDCKGDVEN